MVTAVVNLFSKQYATIYGVSFTVAFFLVFTISERINIARHRKVHGAFARRVQFGSSKRQVESESLHARPGGVLVAVRNRNNMQHLRRTCSRTNLRRNDIVVMTVRPMGADSEYDLKEDQVFGPDEKALFTEVVNLAEKEGKPVEPPVVSAYRSFRCRGANRQSVEGLHGFITGVSERYELRRIWPAG